MSATFPFVSPVARPRSETETVTPAWHLADGGYYDNFGTFAALRLLRAVLADFVASGGTHLTIVEITPWHARRPSPQFDERGKGWYRAVAGPLTALMEMRTSSQSTRNRFATELFEELEETRGGSAIDSRPFDVESIAFVMGEEAPLSWHLTTSQKRRITERWTALSEQAPGPLTQLRARLAEH